MHFEYNLPHERFGVNMSKTFLTNPSEIHSLSDRIALMQNESYKRAAEISYGAISTIYLAVLSAYHVVGSAFYLFFCSMQKAGTLPSYAKNVLFPQEIPPKKKSKQIETEIFKFLDRILTSQLNTYQKRGIIEILEGNVSPAKEQAFIEELFKQRQYAEFSHSIILNALIQQGKTTLAAERAALTPMEKLEQKHQTEWECLSSLKKQIQHIDAQNIAARINDVTETNYLSQKGAQIREELPNLDLRGALWTECSTANSFERAAELQKQLNRYIKESSSTQERAEKTFHPLLRLEYYSLLSQRLSLTVDRLKWNHHYRTINDFNAFVTRSINDIHEILERRFKQSNPTFTLSPPEGEIAPYFNQVETELQKLHRAEKDASFTLQGDLVQDMYHRVMPLFNHPDRSALLSIETPTQRKERRLCVMMENVFLFCLKQSPDGGHLVRLLETPPSSEEDLELHRISRNAFERLYEKALPTLESKLRTQFELSVNLEGTLNTPLLEEMKKNAWECDLSSLHKALHLNLEFWHHDLQQVWISHLPIHQREELRALCSLSYQRKMSKLFSAWLVNKTGVPFERSLSFTHLTIPEPLKEEVQALATLRKYVRTKDLKRKLATKRRAPPLTPPFLGTLLTSIQLPEPNQVNSQMTYLVPIIMEGHAQAPLLPTDTITLVKQQIPFNPTASTIDRLRWLETACQNRVYQTHNRGHFILFASFLQIASDLEQAAPLQTIKDFLALVLNSSLTPLEYDNQWRKETLSCYLKFLFTGYDNVPYQVNEEERKYLVQMATLAEFPLPELQVIDGRAPAQTGIVQLGKALQNTPIGLEGIEESTLQLSFQTSPLPSNPKIRELMDALRARQGETLPKDLLEAVLEAYPIEHDEGQQAIARALSYAFRGDLQGEVTYIVTLLNKHPEVLFNEKTMAIPPRIFLLDRLLELQPNHPTALQEIHRFNQELIASNQAPQMLVGFAREIKRLTSLFQKQQTGEHFAQLLKGKIGYQQIKKQYFEGKVALQGFLKLATDEAEFAITSSSPSLAQYGSTLDWNQMMPLLHQTESLNPTQLTYVEKSVQTIFKRQQQQRILVVLSPPFYLTFGRSDLDIVSGCLYFDGEQYLELPSFLQNHPHIRSLGIHHLPYIQNGDGSFSHCTMEGNRKVPQVRIASGENGVTVQRRLNTSFQRKQIQLLQYYPLEMLQAFPAALSRRMGVKEFWLGPDKTLYGYSEKGTVIFSLNVNNCIQTTSGKFYLSTKINTPQAPLTAALTSLKKIISLDEVLVSHDQKLISIPAIDLQLTFENDQKWHWTSPGITGMTLDLTQSFSSTFVLKWDGVEAQPTRKLEDQLILLRKHLREGEAIIGPSLLEKEQIANIKKEIVLVEEKLAKRDKRLYITLLPLEKDYQRAKQALNDQVDVLKTLSRQISLEGNSQDNQRLQQEYLKEEKKYHAFKEAYETCCRKLVTVSYETSHLGHVKGRDFLGSLFLLSQQLQKGDAIDPCTWIEELATTTSYHFFDEETVDMLKTFVENYSRAHPLLALYFQLLLTDHSFKGMKEVAKSLKPDQEKCLKDAQTLYAQQKNTCAQLHRSLAMGSKIPPPLMALLHEHCPELNGVHNPQLQEAHPLPPALGKNLQALASQSPLERLGLSDAMTCTPKNAAKEIPEEQRRLIKAFNKGSQDQAAGFYVEAFGMFSKNSFYREFSLNGEQALFGLKKGDLDSLFKTFIEKGWIQQKPQEIHYSLSSDAKYHPLTSMQTEDLLALIADLPISHRDREKVVRRIRTFFFQVAHASFSFAWNDNGSKTRFEKALGKERARLEQQMLDAKFYLDHYLRNNRLTLTELKKKVICGEKLDRPEGRTALICYLFYKSEIDHIDNIFKAPPKGERNQIELLSTARQYPIDLLLHKAITEEERELQIIQLAFLMFEEDYGARCNPMQVKLFSSLMRDQKFEEAIDAMQARMGFGKTALLPLLGIVQLAKEALLREEEKSLVRYVVPKAVLQDNATAFDQRISHILGSNVIQDREFSRYQIDPVHKTRSFKWALDDLQTRLNFYENARRQGIILIQSPEIRQSMEAQEKAFGFLAINGELNKEEKGLCLQCKQKLGQIRSLKTYTIFDELDATQDFKACEVNFTEGRRIPILPETIRPLERIIQSISSYPGRERMTLALDILRDLQIQDPQGLFAQYVTSPDKTVDAIRGLKEALNALDRESYLTIYLIRATLLDPNIFDFIHSKQPNTHFGVRFTLKEGKRIYSLDPESGSALLIAVPYEGTNTPKGLSTYDCSEVAALTTLRYYNSNETLFEEVHLDFLIKQMQKHSIPPFLEEEVKRVVDRNGKNFMERLGNLAGLIDVAEIEEEKKMFYQDFLKAPTREVRIFFGRAVVATQVHTDEARANSNRYEMGTPQDQIRGCSGTVSSTSSYFEKAAIDPAADGILSIAIMGRKNNETIHSLPQVPDPCNDYLNWILTELLKGTHPSTRAIIDAAGLCKSRDGLPETIVEKLWTLLLGDPKFQGIEGIVYYGKDNVKRVYRGPAQPPIPCTTAMEIGARTGKKYFSFYGQKNTRGSDIKQANGVHALVTMDENVPNNDAKQAVLRFRDLIQESSGQTFTFALTRQYHDMLQKRKEGGKGPDAKDIIKDLRQKELDQQHHDALILFRKELEAHIEQAALHIEHQVFGRINLTDPNNRAIYHRFLEERHQVKAMIEKSIDTLEKKYGGALTEVERDRFIEEECRKTQNAIDRIAQIAQNIARQLRTAPNLQVDFFKKRIETSKKLFENRYPQETPVKISAVDSGAEAVAMALAEAEAEALAEAVAETISEAVVAAEPRLPSLGLTMTNTPHYIADEGWFDEPKGIPIANHPELQHLIHPDLRDHIHLSPHLQNQRIISHFALIPYEKIVSFDPPLPYLFISQEEGDKWKTTSEGKQNDYELRDLRKDHPEDKNDPLLQNMKEAVLRQTQPIPQVKTTKDLRTLNLINVTAEQLLPSLTINGEEEETIATILDLTSFGITTNRTVSTQLILAKQNNVFLIQAGRTAIKIPTNNECLAPLFAQIPAAPGKFQWLKTQLNKQSAALRQKLEELRQQERLLNRKKQTLHQLVENVSQFTITYTLRKGLNNRDAEFTTGDSSSRGKKHPLLQTCGALFLEKMGQIQKTQNKFKTEKTSEALQELDALFSTFISNKMRNAQNLTSLPAFTREEWEKLIQDMNPPLFDLVYGRILYTVHGGQINKAKECGRDDCQQMFNVTLPAMQTTMEEMRDAITKLPEIEKEIQEIQNALAALNAQIKNLEEANQCIKEMENQTTPLLNYFSNQGIVFVPPSQNGTLFWDRLHFDSLATLPEAKHQLQFTGLFPVYSKTLASMNEYKRRIHSLNKEEETTMSDHQTLFRTVSTLAAQVEERATEMTWQ